ncbi:hypothetical protein [Archaeoglobus veneficus]|uniref:hypothetical protein n=1 Tax=Archaeoglobus veneficus TaxID=58290 RepID=UPI0018DC50D1|nr:hypothetical protein [Archaeoglobus veneficus]
MNLDLDYLGDELEKLGAELPKKEVRTEEAPADGILPDGFYITTHHPTYVYLNGGVEGSQKHRDGLCYSH